MTLSRSHVQALYTRSIDRYSFFSAAFRVPQGIQALLQSSGLIRPGLRVLDAGCGHGIASFALLEAMRLKKADYKKLDGFDLTPAMLSRFEKRLNDLRIEGVELRQADVLALEGLPPSWKDYDLILSTSMLEYLPKPDVPRALKELRARLAKEGRLLVMITRRTPETKAFIEWTWRAERYSREELRLAFRAAGFERLTFRRFPWRYFWLNRANYVVEAL
jgi:ubiquinone/menaquinone biosynthesis C-methylase UbiE